MSSRVPFLDDECYPIAVPEKLVSALRRSIDNIHEYVSQNSFSTPAEKAVVEAIEAEVEEQLRNPPEPEHAGEEGGTDKIPKRKNQRTMKKSKPKKMVSTKLTSIDSWWADSWQREDNPWEREEGDSASSSGHRRRRRPRRRRRQSAGSQGSQGSVSQTGSEGSGKSPQRKNLVWR